VSGFTSRPDVQRLNRNSIYIFVNRPPGARPADPPRHSRSLSQYLPPAVFPRRSFFWKCRTTKWTSTCIPAKIEVASGFAIWSTISRATRFVRRLHGHAADCKFCHCCGGARRPSGPAMRFHRRNRDAPQQRIRSAACDHSAHEEIGLGSGVVRTAFRSDFRPMQPWSSEFPFTSGTAFGAALAPARILRCGELGANLAAPSADASLQRCRGRQIADLKPLGQVSASFIIAVNGEGLWIVDQHVATSACSSNNTSKRVRAGKIERSACSCPW